jgi:hypothetical protein
VHALTAFDVRKMGNLWLTGKIYTAGPPPAHTTTAEAAVKRPLANRVTQLEVVRIERRSWPFRGFFEYALKIVAAAYFTLPISFSGLILLQPNAASGQEAQLLESTT